MSRVLKTSGFLGLAGMMCVGLYMAMQLETGGGAVPLRDPQPMDNNHTAIRIIITNPEQQSVNDVFDDIYTLDTEGENIDGVELHLPHISGGGGAE